MASASEFDPGSTKKQQLTAPARQSGPAHAFGQVMHDRQGRGKMRGKTKGDGHLLY